MTIIINRAVLGPFQNEGEAAEGLLKFLASLMVPPSGVEPELPSEPDFESGASTNSAKGAYPVGEGVSPMDAADIDWQMGTPRSTPNLVHPGTLVDTSRARDPLPGHMVDTLKQITLPFGWSLEDRQFLAEDRNTAWSEYQVRIVCGPTIDNMTGTGLDGWNGRWWRLSRHMTPGEIVQTVFKATMTALEHEARELFLYKGVSVLDPHYDIDKMVEFRKDPSSIRGRS